MTNILQPIIERIVGKSAGNLPPVQVGTPSIPKSMKRVRKVLPSNKVAAKPNTPEGLVRLLKSAGRYAVLLKPQVTENLSSGQIVEIVELLGSEMSRIPSGPVSVEFPYLCEKPASTAAVYDLPSFLLDRFAVTNAEFKQFVDEGCYKSTELWESEVVSALGMFVDQTGKPGPSGWKNGTYPENEKSHPVVGVSWHEATAYARWVGKRLPTRAEWVKAASWPLVANEKPTRQRAFPWGDIFDTTKMNVWTTGLRHAVPVDEFQDGNSASNVCQLCGNVWEWISDEYQTYSGDNLVAAEDSVKALRGGAFDTYFERQASCQFESGDNCFSRKSNIGFRCAASLDEFALEAQDLLVELKSSPHVAVAEPSKEPWEEKSLFGSDSNKDDEDTSISTPESKSKSGRSAQAAESKLRKWATETIDRVKSKTNKDTATDEPESDDDTPYQSPFAGPGF